MRSRRIVPSLGRRPVALLLAAALVGVALVMGPGSSFLSGSPREAGTADLSPVAGPWVTVAPAFVAPLGSTAVGEMPPNAPMKVVVALALSDPKGLEARVALEYAPGSSLYHAFLSPAQITELYGPTLAAYASAVGYFEHQGLNVTTSPDRTLLTVSGPARLIGPAFHTSFSEYRLGSHAFFSHPSPATLPSGIPWAGAYGLGNQSGPVPHAARVPTAVVRPSAGCPGASGPLIPCQVQSVYNLSGFIGSGVNGTGYRIGVVDTYDGSEPQPQLQADLASFTSNYSIPLGTVNYLYPVPTQKDLNATNTGWGLEAALDLEWSRAMAPGATIDMTFAPDATTGLYSAVDWLVAHHAVDVLSLSWGEPDVGVYNSFSTPCSTQCNASTDGTYSLLLPVLAAAAAEGIGVFSSSGDCGAAEGTDGVSTSYPASDPSVTGVGGTVLTIGSGNGYVSERGWSGNATGASAPGCANQGGSGGGYAPFPRPWWQQMSGLPAGRPRGVPDVSIIGGTPVSIVYSGGFGAVLGTSEGTPMWAAIEAIADQLMGQSLGSLNPSLYALARGAGYSTFFHDVTTGNNGYGAGTGWDALTGLGSPVGSALLPALSASRPGPSGLYAYLGGTPRFLKVGQSATFTASAIGGASPYAFFDVAFGDGNASLTTGGTATHAYASEGVYPATAVVFDAAANSSVSAPIPIVVGGGGPLNVSLSAVPNVATVGQNVTFTTTVTGGTGPFRFSYSYGDGTYLANSTNATPLHIYGSANGFCAAVVVSDSALPPNGGASSSVAVRIGGAVAPPCQSSSPLVVNFTSSITAADLPADFPFAPHVSGGSGAVTTQYVSDDPYVSACNCGIFRTVGTHLVTVFVNDSVNQETRGSLSVTTYPALTAQFTATTQAGIIPLAVTFHAAAAGGHGANAAATLWVFGDGASAVGAVVSHTYLSANAFVAIASLQDQGHGNASEAFVIQAQSSSLPALVATITPAIHGYAGAPVYFHAAVVGGSGSYQYYQRPDGSSSAYGPDLNESFALAGCLGLGTCPLTPYMSVSNATGTVSVSVTLPSFLSIRSEAIAIDTSITPASGPAPLAVVGAAVATGPPASLVLWNLGDGASARGTTFQHSYALPGNYTVVANSTDGFGDAFLRSTAVAVAHPTGPPLVIAGGLVGSGPTLAPYAAQLTANASGGIGPPYSFAWTFGDGANASGANVTHLYNQTGAYDANVTVRDSAGNSATHTVVVNVYALTPVQITMHLSGFGGASLALVTNITVGCGIASVPGCGPASVVLGLSYTDASGNPLLGFGMLVTFSDSGTANSTLPPPTSPGDFHLSALVLSTYYTGSANLPFTIPSGSLLELTVSPTGLLLGGVAIGILVGAAVLLRRRGGE